MRLYLLVGAVAAFVVVVAATAFAGGATSTARTIRVIEHATIAPALDPAIGVPFAVFFAIAGPTPLLTRASRRVLGEPPVRKSKPAVSTAARAPSGSFLASGAAATSVPRPRK